MASPQKQNVKYLASGNISGLPPRKQVRAQAGYTLAVPSPVPDAPPVVVSASAADSSPTVREAQLSVAAGQRWQVPAPPIPASARRAQQPSAQQQAENAVYGALRQYIEDSTVEEIWVNSPTRVFVARNGKPELTATMLNYEQVRVMVERLLLASGRRIDTASPFVDAALPGGHRLHVVIPPITTEHWAINIRKHIVCSRRLDDLVALQSLSREAASVLAAAVNCGHNILVSGATQAGKTTMLRALCGAIPATQRVIVCEEVAELALAHRDTVAMQTRPPSMEDRGEVTLRRLVKESLRMRPERIIVGEVREAESLDLLIALNAGIAGMGTIHANSSADALAKLTVLPLLAGPNVSSEFVTRTVAQALTLIVHCNRDNDGKRYVESIRHVTGRVENGIISSNLVFQRENGQLVRSRSAQEYIQTLQLKNNDDAIIQLRQFAQSLRKTVEH